MFDTIGQSVRVEKPDFVQLVGQLPAGTTAGSKKIASALEAKPHCNWLPPCGAWGHAEGCKSMPAPSVPEDGGAK